MENIATKETKSNRKERTGVVVSDCQEKTIVVEVTRTTSHKLYKKVLKRKKRYHAHDENNEAKVGDKVIIAETRPLSKLKRWRLKEIISRAQ
ncbi:MAG: 30S ribosomal protein S17 [Lentisphaerae bacterium GWF2_45_14]|nr:MAG: 30S ribosomal protein S17 [Lentisphaerae bacterium GWF2_45_14]